MKSMTNRAWELSNDEYEKQQEAFENDTEKHCDFCGKDITHGDFCSGDHRRRFFEDDVTIQLPHELEAVVDTGRRVGGLNHVYLENKI